MGFLSKSKSNSNKKNDGRPKGDRDKRQIMYVTVSSKKAVFLITGEPREAKYSYGIPIIPLHGYYYSPKHKRTFTAGELRDYYVILNVPKGVDLDELRDVKVVITGYYANEIYLDEPEDGEKNGDSEKE